MLSLFIAPMKPQKIASKLQTVKLAVLLTTSGLFLPIPAFSQTVAPKRTETNPAQKQTTRNLISNGDLYKISLDGSPASWFISKDVILEKGPNGNTFKIGPCDSIGPHLRSRGIDFNNDSPPEGGKRELLVRFKFKTLGILRNPNSGTHYKVVFRLFDDPPDQYGNSTGKFLSSVVFAINAEQSGLIEKQLIVPVGIDAESADFCVDDTGYASTPSTVWIRDVSAVWNK